MPDNREYQEALRIAQPAETVTRITYPAAGLLLKQAVERPGGCEAMMLKGAPGNGLRIEFQKHHAQVLGYDAIVAGAWQREEGTELEQAYAQLVLTSINSDLLRPDCGK